MNTLAEYLLAKLESGAKAVNVSFVDETLVVELDDGRSIWVPVAYYPRLFYGHPAEREIWVLEGEGIHWPELDEDIRTADLLIGLPSAESQASLQRWLSQRQHPEPSTA
jgi:hypothetical protein